VAESRTITLKSDLAELRRLAAQIEDFGRACGLDRESMLRLNLVLEELTANIIFYGYRGEGEHLIHIRLELMNQELRVQIEDEAEPFDPLQQRMPDIDRPLERRPIGGLGIFLVRQLMDELDYRRERGRNILTMKQRIAPAVA
jgi:anti-sigma regulatory factor (Ser/Thr protein kinase)